MYFGRHLWGRITFVLRPISLSPNDSPAGFKELLGTFSPPPAPVKPLAVTPLAPGRKCIGLSVPSLLEVKITKRLASNDLRHRLVQGAIPGFDAGEPSTDGDCLVSDFGDTSGVVGNSAGCSHLMVRSKTSNLCLENAAPPSSSLMVPTIPPTESCVVSTAETKSHRGYLTKCNTALARMKQVCLDSEEVCQPSPPVPPTVPPSSVSPSVPPLVECTATDVRRVIVQDVRKVVDVSESPIDVSSSSPLSQDNVMRDTEIGETDRTLKILRELFHKPTPAALPPQRCCSKVDLVPSSATVQSTTVTDNCVGVVSSPILFDDVLPSSSWSSCPVAPPLPVGEQLHPVR